MLLAYSKIWLYDELVASPLPDDPWVATALAALLPARASQNVSRRYMLQPPAAREIIATHVLNSMINRVGSTFVHRLCETTGAKAHEVVRAYLLAREIFGLVPLWQAIEALDNKVDDAVQSQMLIDTSDQLERGTMWFLRSRRLPDDMATTIAYFQPNVEALSTRLPRLLDAAEQARRRRAGRRARRARRAARSSRRAWSPSIRCTRRWTLPKSRPSRQRRGRGGRGDLLRHRQPAGLAWLSRQDRGIAGRRALERARASAAMQDDVAALARNVTSGVIAGSADGATSASARGAWRDANRRALERSGQLLGELRSRADTRRGDALGRAAGAALACCRFVRRDNSTSAILHVVW